MHAKTKGTCSHDVFARNGDLLGYRPFGKSRRTALNVRRAIYTFFLCIFASIGYLFVRQLAASHAAVKLRVADCSPLRLHEQKLPLVCASAMLPAEKPK